MSELLTVHDGRDEQAHPTSLDVAELRRQAHERAIRRASVPFEGWIDDELLASTSVRRYVPTTSLPSATGAPTFFFLHGGYGVFGDLELQDAYCRILATAVEHVVISVDYPLAPEHTFAQSVAAIQSVLTAEGPHSSVVCGDSAGGALAVAVARRHQSGRGSELDGLLLTNPNLALSLASLDPLAPAGPDADLLAEALSLWLADPRLQPRLDRTADGLPPTLVAVGKMDSLRIEARELRDACSRAGVRSQLLELAGVGHGFVNEPDHARRVARRAQAFFGLHRP